MAVDEKDPKTDQAVAPESLTGQQQSSVSDPPKLLTREEVDRILAGKGKEVEKAKADALAAQADAKAKADALAKAEADKAATEKALAEMAARTQSFEERERARIDQAAKEAEAIVATWSESDRAELAGLDPEARLRAVRLVERRSTTLAQQAMATAVHGGQPRPPAYQQPKDEDYTADAAARLAARQRGLPLKKKQ